MYNIYEVIDKYYWCGSKDCHDPNKGPNLGAITAAQDFDEKGLCPAGPEWGRQDRLPRFVCFRTALEDGELDIDSARLFFEPGASPALLVGPNELLDLLEVLGE